MLLGTRSADTARRRLGHAISARIRVAIFPRACTRPSRDQGRDGALVSGASQYTFKMPDLGEGTVEAEIVRWYVQRGDVVAEDQAIVEVMTDKASVEVPAPVSGRVVSVTGTPGDKVAVGSTLIVFDLETQVADAAIAAPAAPTPAAVAASADAGAITGTTATRVMASPANRRRAREAGL